MKQRKIGLLAMPDNSATNIFFQIAKEENVPIHFVIFWKPKISDQIKRTLKKLRASGFSATIQRITYALTHRTTQNDVKKTTIKEYFVSSHNGKACREILQKEEVDILILLTDAIVGRRLLAIPKLITLNSHPGWSPQYRGLGSAFYHLKHGKKLGLTVHKVDEGIDTGPIIERREIDVDLSKSLQEIMNDLRKAQYKLMLDTVARLQKEDPVFIDTFLEPSNMTHGMSIREQKKLEKKFAANPDILLSSNFS